VKGSELYKEPVIITTRGCSEDFSLHPNIVAYNFAALYLYFDIYLDIIFIIFLFITAL